MEWGAFERKIHNVNWRIVCLNRDKGSGPLSWLLWLLFGDPFLGERPSPWLERI